MTLFQWQLLLYNNQELPRIGICTIFSHPAGVLLDPGGHVDAIFIRNRFYYPSLNFVCHIGRKNQYHLLSQLNMQTITFKFLIKSLLFMLQADSGYSVTSKTPVGIKCVNVGFVWTFFFFFSPCTIAGSQLLKQQLSYTSLWTENLLKWQKSANPASRSRLRFLCIAPLNLTAKNWKWEPKKSRIWSFNIKKEHFIYINYK